MTAPPAAPSLLARLLAAIIGPLLALAALLLVGSAILIHALAERTSDRVLLGSLAAIAETLAIEDGEITLDLPPAAFGMLEDSERDNVYYSIRHGQALLSGYRDLPSPSPGSLTVGEPQVRDVRFRGETVRVAAVARRLPRLEEPVTVQVAETLKARNKLQQRLALILGGLVVGLVAAAGLLIPPAVAWGLRPLDRLRGQVAARTHDGPMDLSPLPLDEAPREVRPFVEAFNALLKRLEASTASMRRFTADASHQMRTPLAALRTHLSLARRPDTSPPEQAVALSEVEIAAARLERLLAQLLSLARADERGEARLLGEIDLTACVRTALADMAPSALAAGVDLALEAPNAPVRALGDPFLLGEALHNLLDNAVRYNRPGGAVTVAVGQHDERPQVVIEDNGPGVPEAARAAIFERFARLPQRDAPAGSGLGLAIVQALAEKLGARVALAGREDGRPGLRVILTLAPPEPCDS